MTIVLELLLALVLAQSSTGQSATGTGIIRGRITDRQTGQPIAHAIVSIMFAATGGQSTRADADGRYSFAALPPGRYMVSAESPIFRASHVHGVYTPTAPGATPTSWLTLADAEVRTDVDISLARAVAISGRVLDDLGVPAARVRIVATRMETGDRLGGWSRSTDDLGRFRVFGLQPGRYVVCAEMPFVDMRSINTRPIERPVKTCYPRVASETESVPVTVGAEDIEGIDIRLLRSRTFTISGIVLDSSGTPVERPMVSFTTYRANGSSSAMSSGGPDGRFVIRNVSPGQYSVGAGLGGLVLGSEPTERISIPITVTSSDVENLVLMLSKTVTVTGRVVFEGTTTPPGRDPGYGPMLLRAVLEGETFRLSESGGSGYVFNNLTFELTGLFGRRTLTIFNLPSGWMQKSVIYKGKDVTDTPTDFQAVSDPSELQVIMSNRGAIVSGRVLGEDGNPVRGRVLMVPTARARWAGLGRPITVLSASGTGGFGLPPQRDGEYAIAAVNQTDALPALEDRELFERILKSGQTITLTEGDRRAVDLRITKLPDKLPDAR